MEKVIPRSINYSDIKPECIENMIKLVRFTPTATVNDAKANDIVRFYIQGNSFFDPYSSYIRIEVSTNYATFRDVFSPTVDGGDGDTFRARLLDRSAHSFINRLVIKSQGQELERIEHYDIAAAMINDMILSYEQSLLHNYEGFPMRDIDVGANVFATSYVDGMPTTSYGAPLIYQPLAGSDPHLRHVCDQGFWGMRVSTETFGTDNLRKASLPVSLAYPRRLKFAPSTSYNISFPGKTPPRMGSYIDTLRSTGLVDPAGEDAGVDGVYLSENSLVFCIPIYSGIIGVLYPDRKLLPLSLMPLELEFTLNPYAFYDVGATPENSKRQYTVNKFWIYTHVMTFEQELHRSLEAVVAENGIFIHFNSFYLAPIATHMGDVVYNYVYINIHAKSIQSVHFVYIYSGYEANGGVRKLHFVNHNISSLQIRNGTELYPSEPIYGDQYTGKNRGMHYQFLLETLKGWGKMHDPTTDAAIQTFNYVTDEILLYPNDFMEVLFQYAQIGRCQYAISMEGEELGQDKQLISGRKGLIPFDINTEIARKAYDTTSYQFIFIKADYLIYVRPDLVVTLLGK